MLPPPLPQELYDQIIDNLHDDPKSLSACSLVCRTWLNSSRVHKFSTTVLHLPKNKTFEQCPVAADFSQELLVFDFETRPNFLDISSCVKLQELSLNRVVIPDCIGISSSFFLPKLHTLTLHRCQFVDFAHFARFLYNFPCLESLFTTKLSWPAVKGLPLDLNHPKYVSPPLNGELRISELDLSKSSLGHTSLLELLPLLPGGIHFRTVVVSTTRECVEAVNVLLRACGSDLEVLNLSNLNILDDVDSDPPVVDLSHNNNLRRLAMPRVATGWDHHRSTWLTSMLSTVSSHTMAKIIMGQGGFGYAVDWEGVDILLSTDPRFANLQTVKLHSFFKSDTPELLELPWLRSRGILVLEVKNSRRSWSIELRNDH